MKKILLFGLLLGALAGCTSTQEDKGQEMTSRSNLGEGEYWWIVEYEDEQSD